MVVGPMNDRFQPNPSSTSPLQKCATVMPEMPTMAVAAISAKPMPVIGSTPKRAIKEPVIKLGAYIARMALSPFPPMRSMTYLPVANPGQRPGQQRPRYRLLVIILAMLLICLLHVWKAQPLGHRILYRGFSCLWLTGR